MREGLTLTTESIGILENVLTAGFEYDYLYTHHKNIRPQTSLVSYITPRGRWQSTTWPTDKVERCTGQFYSWGKKSIYLGDDTLIASDNGYEWAVVSNDIPVGDELFDTCGLLFLPGRDRKTAHVSIDGINFGEIALSGAESGHWNHFATTHTAILATFTPSKHETFLRLGTIQTIAAV